jgi:hypothetical protein
MQRWQRCVVVSRATGSGTWRSGSRRSFRRGTPLFMREFQHPLIAARRRGCSAALSYRSFLYVTPPETIFGMTSYR